MPTPGALFDLYNLLIRRACHDPYLVAGVSSATKTNTADAGRFGHHISHRPDPVNITHKTLESRFDTHHTTYYKQRLSASLFGRPRLLSQPAFAVRAMNEHLRSAAKRRTTLTREETPND